MKRILIIWALLISVCFAQSKAGFYVVGGKIITVQDTSSRKYLKAIENAGVVPSVTQNFASNYLVTSERAIGTYTLIKAQYPFIGGTAATHKFNLNDPRDLDAAYRLTFPNGMTHSSNGIQGNGTNQYSETFLTPSVSLTASSTHISIYSNTTPTGVLNTTDISTTTNSANGANMLEITTFNSRSSQEATVGNASANLDGLGKSPPRKGYLLASVYLGTFKFLRNSDFDSKSLVITPTNSTASFKIGVRPSSNIYYSPRAYQLATIGSGLTDTQAILQSRAVTSFEGFLGRQ